MEVCSLRLSGAIIDSCQLTITKGIIVEHKTHCKYEGEPHHSLYALATVTSFERFPKIFVRNDPFKINVLLENLRRITKRALPGACQLDGQ